MGWFFNPFTGKFDYSDEYTDAEAVSAMGAKGDANPLHHDKYTDSEVAAIVAVHAAIVSDHHARYTNAEAKAAAIAGWTASRALQVAAGGGIEVSPVTLAELNYLDGVTSAIQAQLDAKVAKALFDAHTILIAITDDTPAALSVPASRIVGRASTGNIVALTGAQLWAILSGQAAANVSMNSKKLTSVTDPTANQDAATKAYADLHVLKSLYNAQSILAAVTNNNPAMLAVAEDRLLGRRTGQNIEAITPANIWAFLSGHAGAAVDMEGQFFSDMPVENGATVPASPRTGELFLHTPTGRNVLMIYDGSNWIPIISIGTMTMYVDATDGSDSIDKGTGVDANAFATVLYAFNQIPGLVGGNVIIYVNDETYNETVTIQGKMPTGDYSITLSGTLSSQATDTDGVVVAGTGAQQALLTDADANFANYEGMLVHLVDNDEYRIIDGHGWTLGFDAGRTEPAAGEIIMGATSGAHGTYVKTNALSGGAWNQNPPTAAGGMTILKTWGTYSDNEILANISQQRHSGAATGTTANHLITTGENFAGEIGVAVHNTTDDTWARCTAWGADDLTLDADIFVDGEDYVIYEGPGLVNVAGGNAVDTINLVLVGTATAVGANAEYVVYDWGTEIDYINIQSGQLAVNLEYISTLNPAGYTPSAFAYSSVSITSCKLNNTISFNGSKVTIGSSYSVRSSQGAQNLLVLGGSNVRVDNTKFFRPFNTGSIIGVTRLSNFICSSGCVLDGNNAETNKATYGMQCGSGGQGSFYTIGATGKNWIRNCDTGVYADTGGQVSWTTGPYCRFSNNAVNTQAVAASYGYIA